MSFSFNARGATKAAALTAVVAELEKVVEFQPVHKHDAHAVMAAAEAHVGLLPDDESRDVIVSVSGWVQWEGTDADPRFVGASVTVSATLVTRS